MLLRNNNGKFIKELAANCLKANKNRNRIAILAIILTTVLFMSVVTVFQGYSMVAQEQSLRMAGNKYMAAFNFLNEKEAETLKKQPAFIEAGLTRSIGTVQNKELAGVTGELIWMNQNYADNTYKKLTKGSLPKSENEIACDTEVLRKLGVSEKTGAKIRLRYEIGGEVREKSMTLCGIWQGEQYEQKTQILVSAQFADKNSNTSDNYTVSGIFSTDDDLEKQMNDVLKQAGLDSQKVAHDICAGYLSNNGNDATTTMSLAGGILLILAAGYLIIYNIFRISVMKDIRLYGQLKTIGASPKQIKYIVRRQGMRLLLLGMPAGLILGLLIGNLLLIFIMKSTSSGESLFVIPGILFWIAAASFTFITVWVSCSRPGKFAGKISPVEALRCQEADSGCKKEQKGRESKNRIVSMALANLGRNKGKTLLVVLSISISIVLLNTVLNLTLCFDKETYIRRDTVADFNISGGSWTHTADNSEKVVPTGVLEKLRERSDIENLGVVYYHPVDYDKLTEENQELVRINAVNGKEVSTDPDEYISERQIFGFDENVLKRVRVVEGKIDYEKLKSGNYILMAGFLSDSGVYYEDTQEFHAGDKVQLDIAGESKKYTVMAVVGVPTVLLTDYSSGGYESVVLPAEQYLKVYPQTEDNPIHCVFDAKEGQFDKLMNIFDRYSRYTDISVLTKLKAEKEFNDLSATYDAAGTILALIFGFIGLLNLLNVILTGAIARQGEFATMRSIGMTKKQLRKLFIYEGVFYVVLVFILATMTSGLLSATIVRGIASSFWFSKYHFTVLPAVSIAAVFIALSALISYGVDKVYNKGSIIDNLRKVE